MAKVIGSIVSTQKDHSLVGKKLMIVQPINSDGKLVRCEEVAADAVGAGIGEYVLLVRGTGARRATGATSSEIQNDVNDCSIVGIIDRFDK
ncbi:EutN/CcmL family microcompartment protein [Oenococcus oeni]